MIGNVFFSVFPSGRIGESTISICGTGFQGDASLAHSFCFAEY